MILQYLISSWRPLKAHFFSSWFHRTRTDQQTYNPSCQSCQLSCIVLWFFSLQPEYLLPSETTELVRWVLRNKISKRKEVLKHPCILSPPWSVLRCLGAHVPPPLLFSLSEFYIVLQPPPFYFFSLPTLILRHCGKVLAGKKKVAWECTDPSKTSRICTLGLPSPGLLSEPLTAGMCPGKSSLCGPLNAPKIITVCYEKNENTIY